MEPNSPKKIQFDVPPFQNQLDPQAAEHIRRRRPTPATLVIYNEASAAGKEADDKRTTSNPREAPGTELTPLQVDQNVYSPPTMRELQLVVDQHLQKHDQTEAGLCEGPDSLSPITDQHCPNAGPWANYSSAEPNGNNAYADLLCAAEEQSSIDGESPRAEFQQGTLSSPSSVSR